MAGLPALQAASGTAPPPGGDTPATAPEGIYLAAPAGTSGMGYATKANDPWLIYGPQTASGAGNVGLGWVADGVFLNSVNCAAAPNPGAGIVSGCTSSPGTGVSNTDVWSTYGVYEHLWTPKWRTSLFYGGFVGVDYDSTAKNFVNQDVFSVMFRFQRSFLY